MSKPNRILTTLILGACCAPVVCAAQNAPTFMSKYGEIQSVNKYSSNPFWNSNSPYNQRFPQPIYATGPDVNTGDCNRIVQNLISEYCADRNNCSNLRISDVRPIVMVQLSQLPGHNFATSCGGYIDSAFEDYKKSYGNTSAVNVVKQASQPQQVVQIENPFKQKKSEYEIGVAERAAELENLQRVTTPTATVTATEFPKTIDDLSFTDRMANTTAGYEPYSNLNPYKIPTFESEKEYAERTKSSSESNATNKKPGDKTTAPNGTDGGATYNSDDVPTCLAKLTNDSTLISAINSKMSGARKVSTEELKTHQAYTPIAQAAYDYCVGKASAQEVSEFNHWIDGHDILPIKLKINNEEHTLEFNAEELFDYFNGFFVPILIKRDAKVNAAQPQTILTDANLNTDNISGSCSTKFYAFGNMAGAVERFGSVTGLQSAAKEAYNIARAIYFQNNKGVIVYRTDNVVVDVLLPVGPVTSKPTSIRDTNYIAARRKIKTFAEKLKATSCTNQNLSVLLVVPKDKDGSELIVKSEPFFI